MDRARSSEPRGDEKFFFAPGDLGFPTFETPFARIGILICYDRHFPEAARVLGLGGAEIVFVPTNTTRMTRHLWDLELRAHAIANIYYVCGVNKVGVDVGGSARDHHGASLIANPRARSWPRPARRRRPSQWPTWTCRSSPSCARCGGTIATAGRTCTGRWWRC
jgi:predicted amidohydrolase